MMHEWYCQVCGELVIATDRPEWVGLDDAKAYNHTVCAAEAGVLNAV